VTGAWLTSPPRTCRVVCCCGFTLSPPARICWPMPASEWTVEDHLRDKPAAVVALYRRFVELVQACGPFDYAVSKTAITFKGSRRGFAGAKPTADRLDGYLDLQRRVEDPRIRRASPYTSRLVVHQFRISAPEQLDEEFAGWVREAYQVGQGQQVAPRPES
jgi:uncharacterized protein DUF5655